MRYAVVYRSLTGNTKQVAEEIYKQLPQQDVVYMGEPDDKALQADVLFVGSWTDKGSCDAATTEFLKKTSDKTVFLFGTSGFGKSQEYFDEILQRIKALLPQDAKTGKGFMCAGKMPVGLRNRYQAMLEKEPENKHYKMMLENFDLVLAHPTQEDLQNAAAWTRSCLAELQQ